MGCRWKTVKGRRVRVDTVSGPLSTKLLAGFSVADLLGEIRARMVTGSPTFTVEELRDAVIRLYYDEEKGYYVEVRRHPSLPPVIRYITQAEATRLEVNRPSPEFIARIFDWPEIPDH